jgi:hypothetical protein
MDRKQALNKLMGAALDYHMRSRFSRSASLVYDAVTMACNHSTEKREYNTGFIDAALTMVENFAAQGERNALMLVLYAAKGLINEEVPVPQTGVGIALLSMERLAA